MMPILSSLVALEDVVMANSGTTNDDKISKMQALGFRHLGL